MLCSTMLNNVKYLRSVYYIKFMPSSMYNKIYV